MGAQKIYYIIKPIIPRRVQIFLRRKLILLSRPLCSGIWPIDKDAGRPPQGWNGWPDGMKFALVLTHDVDTAKGQDKCKKLMDLEEELGFRSSFNFVPERYRVSAELRKTLGSHGFEIGVHGLNHDGKLYKSQDLFQKRALRINRYLQEWGSIGFRSPAMHHNLDWIHDLNIEYDASTFDTDPFEPHSDGVKTIFPFWVAEDGLGKKYIELPYTLPQDFTLFILMKERAFDIWQRKLDWIAEQGGMALINTHPDYMSFNGDKLGFETYPVEYYTGFLQYIRARYEGAFWHVLPKEIAEFWSKRDEIHA